jgi:hypothetical protein
MSDAPKRELGGLSALQRMRGTTGAPAPATVDTSPAAAPLAATAPQEAPAPQDALPPSASAVEPPQEASMAPQKPVAPSSRPRRAPAAPRPAQRPSASAGASPLEKMTTYIARDTRERAKAAYRATGHLEGDGSFSDFVESAIARELARREKLYNDGERYAGDGVQLTRGRRIS